MKLEKILEKSKRFDDHLTTLENYTLGAYDISKFVNTYDAGYTLTSFTIRANGLDRYMPEISYDDGIWGNGEKKFEIQTTAYGAMKADEIEKVIAGYQEAVEVVRILTKEFINE